MPPPKNTVYKTFILAGDRFTLGDNICVKVSVPHHPIWQKKKEEKKKANLSSFLAPSVQPPAMEAPSKLPVRAPGVRHRSLHRRSQSLGCVGCHGIVSPAAHLSPCLCSSAGVLKSSNTFTKPCTLACTMLLFDCCWL